MVGSLGERLPLSRSQRDRLSGALHDFVDEATRPLQALFSQEPQSGSRLRAFIDRPIAPLSSGDDPVRNALDSIIFASLAGLDHLRLLAITIDDNRVTFGAATVTRGAVEAFARAWWLLSSNTNSELVVRWLSGVSKELRTAISIDPEVTLFEISGAAVPAGQQQKDVLRDIELLSGSPKPLAVSYTQLAVELQNALKNPSGRAYYSHLSAVAHAEGLGLHGFADRTNDGYDINTPEKWGVMYALQGFGTASLVARMLLDAFGIATPETHPLVIAHDRALSNLAEAHRLAFS